MPAKKRPKQRQSVELDLEAIRGRLLRAGHARPTPNAPPQPRAFSPEAQRAREELREHIIADMWALLDAVESLRGAAAPKRPRSG
ncbi:MAG: hypothetical protein EPO68_01850 [Planctomycetota bacterium]|nr:MAG: hypothetical protein EPO68_01850 [Planctomycetota bacterium]